MLQSGLRKFVAAIAGAAAVGMVPAAAWASPPSGITVENLAAGDLNVDVQENHDRVKFQTKDPTDFRLQRLTFGSGSATGWHHHPGVVLVTVQTGSVTVWHTDCSQKTYGPGSPNGNAFVEGIMVHQATSESGATVYATYIVPDGSPVRVEDQVPFCATSF
jgi:hypothetical protein